MLRIYLPLSTAFVTMLRCTYSRFRPHIDIHHHIYVTDLRPGTWVRDYFEVMGCSLALDAHIYPCRFYLYGLGLEIPKSWDAFKHWMLTITQV